MQLNVNGRTYEADVEPNTPLLWVLRDNLGLQVVGGTPEAFSAHIRKETARWADVVKRSGAKME